MTTDAFDFADFIRNGEAFLTELVNELEAQGIPARRLTIDHLCFRVATAGEYAAYRSSLLNQGTLLSEAQINGRSICTFRLDKAFVAGQHRVELLELPAPKEGTPYRTGFEHAELVIAESFADFRARYPHLALREGGPQVLNPELSLKLGGLHAKFHHFPLDRIIEMEEAQITDVVWDLDGTLIRSREAIYEINRQVFSQVLGREITPTEVIEKFHADFPQLFRAFGVENTEQKAQAMAHWSELAGKFTYEIFPGVAEVLVQLRQKGLRQHLWTARDADSAQKILAAHELTHFFSTLNFASATTSKPQPESLEFDWMSLAGRLLVMGDSVSDMRGARAIRALPAAALWDTHASVGDLQAAGAALYFRRPGELVTWLASRA